MRGYRNRRDFSAAFVDHFDEAIVISAVLCKFAGNDERFHNRNPGALVNRSMPVWEGVVAFNDVKEISRHSHSSAVRFQS